MRWKRTITIVIVLSLLLLSLLIASIIWTDDHTATSPAEAALLIVHREGEETIAKDASSGSIVVSSTNSVDVIQGAIDAIEPGGRVLIKTGEYEMSRPVHLKDNMVLEGEGPATKFNWSGHNGFHIEERSNVSLGNFTMIGSGTVLIAGYDDPCANVMVFDVTITTDSSQEGAFYCLAVETTVRDVTFLRCTALDCGTTGFMNNGRSNDEGWIQNISFTSCRAMNCGVVDRYNDWVVGFDLAERVQIRDLLVKDCEASGSWQSGFHFEQDARVVDAVLMDCVATDNGRSMGSPGGEGYGWGYMLFPNLPQHDITLSGCSASGNWRGDTNLGPMASIQP